MVDKYLTESLSYLKDISENLLKITKILENADPVLKIQSNPHKEPIALKPELINPVVETKVNPVVETKEQPPIVEPTETFLNKEDNKSYAEYFNELKELLESEVWPQAVDPELICDDSSVDDQETRAEGLIDFLIDEDLEGKKFLDFGCGEGHVAQKALEKNPLISMGYDIKAHSSWPTLVFPPEKKDGLTTDWDKIIANGPYDVVLINDVLDHLEGIEHVAQLKKIKDVMTPGGRVYVRCHPYCSRHGTHLYKKMNKAFIHLIFSEVELARLGLSSGLFTHKIIHPNMVYKQWFNDSGFDLISDNNIINNLEDFFHMNPIVNERIKDNWRGKSVDPQLNNGRSFPSYQLRIVWIDFILRA